MLSYTTYLQLIFACQKLGDYSCPLSIHANQLKTSPTPEIPQHAPELTEGLRW